MNEDQRRQRIADFERIKIQWVPCETCGDPTHMTSTRRCDGCWEVEHRLRDYLKSPQAQRTVAEALGQAESIAAARFGLIEAVRSWANADCGAKEADEVLACLARFDDLRAKS
jgi:hypothetical protein